MDKPKVHIAIIGHVDHGKTTLKEAIKKYLEENSKKESESSSLNIEKRRTLNLINKK